MNRRDKLKTIIAAVLVGICIGSFVVLGNNHIATRYLAVASMVIWLLVVLIFKRIKKKDEE